MQPVIPTLALGLLAGAISHAETIFLSGINSGFFWYQQNTWTGGSDTQSGFSYGDENGLIHVHRNYQYYGGASRFFEQKDAYIQIDLASLSGVEVASATFHFYVTVNNSPVETFLKHLDTQSDTPAGDAGQKIAGTTDVAGSGSFSPGWNSIDLTSFVLSDLDKGYSFVVLSIPQFAQEQDEDRLLSFYGASATLELEGLSVKPYLLVTTVPEPSAYASLAGGAVLFFALRRRRRT